MMRPRRTPGTAKIHAPHRRASSTTAAAAATTSAHCRKCHGRRSVVAARRMDRRNARFRFDLRMLLLLLLLLMLRLLMLRLLMRRLLLLMRLMMVVMMMMMVMRTGAPRRRDGPDGGWRRGAGEVTGAEGRRTERRQSLSIVVAGNRPLRRGAGNVVGGAAPSASTASTTGATAAASASGAADAAGGANDRRLVDGFGVEIIANVETRHEGAG